MTMMLATPEVEPASSAVTGALLDALARRDFARVYATLAPDVWMRTTLVREVRETHDAVAAVASFEEWFGDADSFEICELEHATVGSRQRLRWQFVLRPTWAPGVPHRIEQVGYASVRHGRIRRIDLVCTGFHPIA